MKPNDMIGKYFKVDYFPSKLAYVYGVEKGRINVLYFCNENGSGLKAIKTSIPTAQKSELKTQKACFSPTEIILHLITEALK